MDQEPYVEEVRSNWTSALFACLGTLSLALFSWRLSAVGWRFLTDLFLFLGIFFFLYTVNYRVLRIEIDGGRLSLQFGLLRWRTEFSRMADCQLDDSPWWIKYGGAGVHFAMVRGKYRVYFNFLEHPRVLVSLSVRQGPVRQICFTTRQPDQVLALLKKEIRTHES